MVEADPRAWDQTWAEAPDYAFVTLDGTPVTSANLRGKVVVLNFWAT